MEPSGARGTRRRRLHGGPTPGVTRSIADALTVKDGDLYFVCLHDGTVPATAHHGFGLYYQDCRFLSAYDLRLGGEAPEVLASAAKAGFKAVIQLTNPALKVAGDEVPAGVLGVLWTRVIAGDHRTVFEELKFTNFGQTPVSLPVDMRFDADFRDIFDIRGLVELHPGTVLPPSWHDGVLELRYDGADGVCRALHVTCSGPDCRHDGERVHLRLDLEAGETKTAVVTLVVAQQSERPAVRPVPEERADVEAALSETCRDWVAGRMRLASDAPLFNRVLDQQFRDLHALRSHLDGDVFFAAGVPWYATLFGRDSLVTAWQTLAYDREIAAQTLRLLAKRQGRTHDAFREEEPGKILHELRTGELANLGKIPHTPYFGSVDSTPLFLVVLARHAAWTGNLMLFHELEEAVEGALAWIDGRLAGSQDGYLSYIGNTEHGSLNQGWKDSDDALVNADGSLCTPPIAMVEVQGYVYLGKRAIADLFERAGDAPRAKRLRAEAEELRERFNRDFWLDEQKIFAMARQAGGRPAAVRSSNPGQALWTGIVDPARAKDVAAMLMADDLFSGWGVRTLSTREKRYNPIGYHLGTVWPHDNALAAAGLRGYGLDDAAMRIFNGIFDAATHFDRFRMPEVFSGYPREPYGEPVRYPVACHPQAWAAGSLPGLVTALLGLEPDAFAGRLRVVRPRLPAFVDSLTVAGLAVGEARVDLRFCRDGGAVQVAVTARHGELDVVVEE